MNATSDNRRSLSDVVVAAKKAVEAAPQRVAVDSKSLALAAWAAVEAETHGRDFDSGRRGDSGRSTVRASWADGALTLTGENVDPETLTRLAAFVSRAVSHLRASPAATIDSLSLLDDTERDTLLVKWNATSQPRNDTDTVHGVFAARAALTPNAAAIRFRDQTLSSRSFTRARRRLPRACRPPAFIEAAWWR